jgi:hypothetical protein
MNARRYALMAGLLIALASTGARAAIDFRETIPVDFTGFVPCADGGAGEDVHIAGEVVRWIDTTVSQSGHVTSVVHANYQGVSGIGLTTGDRYQATADSIFVVNSSFGPSTPLAYTVVSQFAMIGEGSDNNFVVRGLTRVTIMPDGTTHGEVFNSIIDCR